MSWTRNQEKEKIKWLLYFSEKIKKLALELVNIWATTNLYKRSNIYEYSTSFAEAHQGFLSWFDKTESDEKIDEVLSYVQFITIFFTKEKVEKIIEMLQNSQFSQKSALFHQLNILQERERKNYKRVYWKMGEEFMDSNQNFWDCTECTQFDGL